MGSSKISSLSLTSLANIIPIKLNNENYLTWKTLFLPVLKKYKILDLVDGSRPCPPQFLTTQDRAANSINPAYENWNDDDQTLLLWIHSTISDSVIPYVVGSTNSKDLWQSLEKRFSVSSSSHAIQLRTRLQELKKGTSSIHQYLNEIKLISDSLAAAGSHVSDQELVILSCHIK
ncbi:hypothetical protein BVC80_1105g19 [Macleaya cordata]|uniref:Retrotransposon Copia-like N-terminal domain-containing protein n=1 Tax=Macleaya cordata TaxID=56857 RepID=A0A200QBR7_MACCD|nr:hypothetical protein BVC80_1105g19 [Macleaya cordata]